LWKLQVVHYKPCLDCTEHSLFSDFTVPFYKRSEICLFAYPSNGIADGDITYKTTEKKYSVFSLIHMLVVVSKGMWILVQHCSNKILQF